MTKPHLTLNGIVLSLSLAVLPAVAHAEPRGLSLAPHALASAHEQRLRQDIAAMKRARPEAFRAVAELERNAEKVYAARRGRLAPFAPLFKALGPDALLPLLQLLSFESKSAGLEPLAALSLRVGAIEAVGHFRDARSVPVLTAILQGSDQEPDVVRAAAFALGALGSDDVATLLVAESRTARGDAVRAGMGSCRRALVAEELAAALAAESRPTVQRQLIDSLGEAGNAWAWRTPAAREHAAEETVVRNTAAKALLSAYLRSTGSLRDAASNALMVVDAPDSLSLIGKARVGASHEAAAALDALEARLQRNPAR